VIGVSGRWCPFGPATDKGSSARPLRERDYFVDE
jgi:hypothetical protein